MITKATYIERRSASLRALDLEIIRLTDFANGEDGDEALVCYEVIDVLRTQRDNAVQKLREMQMIDDQRWADDDVTSGMENAWREVRNAVLVAIEMT